jgi:hypothetical protein
MNECQLLSIVSCLYCLHTRIYVCECVQHNFVSAPPPIWGDTLEKATNIFIKKVIHFLNIS